MGRRFKLKFDFSRPEYNIDGFPEEEIKKQQKCGADGFLLLSVYEPEGSPDANYTIHAFDGRNGGGRMSDEELFYAWNALASMLLVSHAPEWMKCVCHKAIEHTNKHVDDKIKEQELFEKKKEQPNEIFKDKNITAPGGSD